MSGDSTTLLVIAAIALLLMAALLVGIYVYARVFGTRTIQEYA